MIILADATKARQADKEAAQATRQTAKTNATPSPTPPAKPITNEENLRPEKRGNPPVEQLPVETPFQRAHRLAMEEKPTGLSDYKTKLAGQGFTCFNLPGYGIEFRDSAKQLVARFDVKQGEALDRVFRKTVYRSLSPPFRKIFLAKDRRKDFDPASRTNQLVNQVGRCNCLVLDPY